MFYSIAMALATLLLVIWLKEKVLYLLFPWAYVQNVILAWMYTSGFAGKDACRVLLISKELILLWLFLYFFPGLRRYCQGHWPRPLIILGLFTAWCVVRYAAFVVLQGGSIAGNLWNLRVACFPFEMLVVAVGVAATRPHFAQVFIRTMSYVISVLALLGILLYLLPGKGFWRAYADIASYEIDVKGQSPGYVDEPQEKLAEQEGISGNGVARGAFSQLSPFRAFGTIGDSVGFGHFLAFPVLLVAFLFPPGWRTRLMLLVLVSALLFSFTRSAWVLALAGTLYVLLRQQKYRLILAMALVALTAVIVTPLGAWYSTSLELVSWAPQDYHATGLVWIYREGVWQITNVLGQGMTGGIGMSGDLPESGYGVLLIWYGIPAVLGIVWFCLSMYRTLRESRGRPEPLFLVAEATPLILIGILNFSYYPFSFIPYLLPWFVVGTALAIAARRAIVDPAMPGTIGSSDRSLRFGSEGPQTSLA